MNEFLKDLLRDKTGRYSIREVAIALSLVLITFSWIAQIAFGITTPEYMFYSIVSLVAAGCFGYSIERNQQKKKTYETKTDFICCGCPNY